MLVYTNSVKFDCETIMFYAYVNHARVRSGNQPVLSNEGKVSCSRKQWGDLMGLELTTDRYPPITSQTRYPLRLSHTLLKYVHAWTILEQTKLGIPYICDQALFSMWVSETFNWMYFCNRFDEFFGQQASWHVRLTTSGNQQLISKWIVNIWSLNIPRWANKS